MRILLSPLNWGLGHATRSAALVKRFLAEGHEVVLAGDGESLEWLKAYFPSLRTLALPTLNLTYSKHSSQTWAIARQLPKLLIHALRDHNALCHILAAEHFDLIISDNRFGCYYRHRTKDIRHKTVYITHQIFIPLPKGWHWLEPLAARLHKRLIEHYDECWIPDYANESISLSGRLSHGTPFPRNAKYINPLSRFEEFQSSKVPEFQSSQKSKFKTQNSKFILALISGLEPQATLLEQQLLKKEVLIVRGKTQDEELLPLLLDCQSIIARSGYSTIMDLHVLGLLHKAILYPTPGQPEQEYLATRYRQLSPCPSTHPNEASESLT